MLLHLGSNGLNKQVDAVVLGFALDGEIDFSEKLHRKSKIRGNQPNRPHGALAAYGRLLIVTVAHGIRSLDNQAPGFFTDPVFTG
ncbi:hypothetical protein D3C81_1622330 [compost metagenome]